jgi:coenzyme F420-reducing hydrogenase beta subunit
LKIPLTSSKNFAVSAALSTTWPATATGVLTGVVARGVCEGEFVRLLPEDTHGKEENLDAVTFEKVNLVCGDCCCCCTDSAVAVAADVSVGDVRGAVAADDGFDDTDRGTAGSNI